MATPERSNAPRTCPGEHAPISAAICRTRQRNHYPKCLLCQHRSEEGQGGASTDAKINPSIFGASAVMGRVPGDINEYVVRKVGVSAAQYMRSETPGGSRLLVGCDLRENSRGFVRIFCEGVNKGGMDTVNLGPCPPEMLAFLLGTESGAGAAFIGAGNSSDNVNGIRLWSADGMPIGFANGLQKIGLIARRRRSSRSRLPGQMLHAAPTQDYLAYVRKFAPRPASMRVVVDGGSGVAGRLVSSLVKDLPVRLARQNFAESPHAESLGRAFPSPAVLGDLAEQVRKSGARFGAAFDFNGERVVFVDEKGTELRTDVAGALIATELLLRVPGSPVAYDLRATRALAERVHAAKGKALPGPVERVAFAQHVRRTEAVYGCDLDALHYFKSFFRFPSPFVAFMLMCAHLSRNPQPVSELCADLRRYVQSGEVSLPMPSADAAARVLEAVRDSVPRGQRELIDGVTARMDGWWFNLRRPGKASELRLNIEAADRRRLREARRHVDSLVKHGLEGAE